MEAGGENQIRPAALAGVGRPTSGGLKPEKADATATLTCFYTLKKHVDILEEDFLFG